MFLPESVVLILIFSSCIQAESPSISLEEEKYGVKYASDCEGMYFRGIVYDHFMLDHPKF